MTEPAALVAERLDQLLAEVDPRNDDPTFVRGRQYDLGLAWVHFPEGYGGLDAPPKLQRDVEVRLRDGVGRASEGASSIRRTQKPSMAVVSPSMSITTCPARLRTSPTSPS